MEYKEIEKLAYKFLEELAGKGATIKEVNKISEMLRSMAEMSEIKVTPEMIEKEKKKWFTTNVIQAENFIPSNRTP